MLTKEEIIRVLHESNFWGSEQDTGIPRPGYTDTLVKVKGLKEAISLAEGFINSFNSFFSCLSRRTAFKPYFFNISDAITPCPPETDTITTLPKVITFFPKGFFR